MGKPDFREGRVKKWDQNWKNCHFSRELENQWKLFQFCPGLIEAPFYTFLTQIILHFI